MGRKIQDLTDQTFGQLTVVKRSPNRGGFAMWLCRCKCGQEIDVRLMSLRNGFATKCEDCVFKAPFRRYRRHGLNTAYTLGIENPLYRAWYNMIQRSYNRNHPSYSEYGGRGIKVCNRWRESLQAFIDDMGPKPSKKHTIERRDNNRGYYPENCYWATQKDQQRNKRTNRHLYLNGERMCFSEAAEKCGVKYYKIRNLITKANKKPSLLEQSFEHSMMEATKEGILENEQ